MPLLAIGCAVVGDWLRRCWRSVAPLLAGLSVGGRQPVMRAKEVKKAECSKYFHPLFHVLAFFQELCGRYKRFGLRLL